MVIFGTALLAACYLVGTLLGDMIGAVIGVKANVGGIGIAMLLLVVVQNWLRQRGMLLTNTERGITFWAMMYIPVVVAMAATQNVIVAWKSGPIALIAAAGSFILCACTIAFINRVIPRTSTDESWQNNLAAEKD